MNKKYFFILIPLIALLFSFERGAGNAISTKCKIPVIAGTANIELCQGRALTNINFQRESPRKIRNKIRIKAWDDAGAMVVTIPCTTEVLFSYYNEQVLSRYNNSFRPAQRSANSLRGPPAIG